MSIENLDFTAFLVVFWTARADFSGIIRGIVIEKMKAPN